MEPTKYQIAIVITLTTIILSGYRKDNYFHSPEGGEAATAVSANSALKDGGSGADHVYLLSSQVAVKPRF